MPELPEVETVRAGLTSLLAQAAIRRVDLRRMDLRSPIPQRLPSVLALQPITGIDRRGKYLLWRTPAATMLCHLGMTGTWRLLTGDPRPHDHVLMHLMDGRILAFHDPRRFGCIDLLQEDGRHPALDDLGPEPLGPDFDGGHLYRMLHRRSTAVKAAIMDQSVVVGVGNIYAQEACHRARIRPTLAARRVSTVRADALAQEIRRVLQEAIAAGGSTISDFRAAGGEHGWFQHSFAVYGRAGQPCRSCGATLSGRAISGRSTVWCPRCQT